MSFIYGKFFVNFHQATFLVVNFLPEAAGILFGIHLLDISGAPTLLPLNLIPIPPSPVG
jgi:hypothetical protein